MKAAEPASPSAMQLPAHYRAVRERLMQGRTAAAVTSDAPVRGVNHTDVKRDAATAYTLGFMHGLFFATCLHALENTSVSASSGREITRAPVPAGPSGPPDPDDILEGTCRFYDVCPLDVTSACMSRRVVKARQTAMYLMCALTRKSLSTIGELFGGRHHTTVMHARRKLDRLIRSDPAIAGELQCLKERLIASASKAEPGEGDR